MEQTKIYVLYLKIDDKNRKKLFSSTDKEEVEDRRLAESFSHNSASLEVKEETREKSFKELAEDAEILEEMIGNSDPITVKDVVRSVDLDEDDVVVITETVSTTYRKPRTYEDLLRKGINKAQRLSTGEKIALGIAGAGLLTLAIISYNKSKNN